MLALHNTHMLSVHELKAQDLRGLSPVALTAIVSTVTDLDGVGC